MSSLCVIVVNNYVFHMTIMRSLVAKPISMLLKPKYGYCHLSALIHLPLPCISGIQALILPELYLCMDSEPSKSLRLATVLLYYGPIPVLVRIQYPIFREDQLLQNREGCGAW